MTPRSAKCQKTDKKYQAGGGGNLVGAPRDYVRAPGRGKRGGTTFQTDRSWTFQTSSDSAVSGSDHSRLHRMHKMNMYQHNARTSRRCALATTNPHTKIPRAPQSLDRKSSRQKAALVSSAVIMTVCSYSGVACVRARVHVGCNVASAGGCCIALAKHVFHKANCVCAHS